MNGGSGRRLGVGIIDQFFSGGTNLFVAILAARVLDVDAFGVFGIVMIVYLLAVSSIRALIAEPALVHPPDEYPGGQVGSTMLVSIGLAGAVAAAAAVAPAGDLRTGLFALAVVLPGVAVQDTCRYLELADETPEGALWGDAVWAIGLVVGTIAVVATDTLSVASIILAWGLAGSVGGIGMVVRRRHEGVRLDLRWIRITWYLAWRYLISFFSTFGVAYVAVLGLGAITSNAVVGAVRGAQVVLSPLTLMLSAGLNVLAVDVARRGLTGPLLRARMLRVSIGATAAAMVVCAIALAVPPTIGTLVLGDTWPAARDLLVPASVQMIFLGVWSGAKVGITGIRAASAALRLNLAIAPVVLVAPIVGAVIADGAGFFWMLGATHALIAWCWWRGLIRFTDSDAAPFPIEGDPVT